jgi:hypothetical protein
VPHHSRMKLVDSTLPPDGGSLLWEAVDCRCCDI